MWVAKLSRRWMRTISTEQGRLSIQGQEASAFFTLSISPIEEATWPSSTRRGSLLSFWNHSLSKSPSVCRQHLLQAQECAFGISLKSMAPLLTWKTTSRFTTLPQHWRAVQCIHDTCACLLLSSSTGQPPLTFPFAEGGPCTAGLSIYATSSSICCSTHTLCWGLGRIEQSRAGAAPLGLNSAWQ